MNASLNMSVQAAGVLVGYTNTYMHELVILLVPFVSSDFDLQRLCLSPELLDKLFSEV